MKTLPKKLQKAYEGYSEDINALNEVLKDITITAACDGAERKSDLGRNYKYTIKITRNDNTISFQYHGSINDYQNNDVFPKDFLYNILCCIGLDYHVPDSFNDFCDEFGYNNDSIKDKKLFSQCIKQADKLRKIFTEKEIESFPS